MCHHFAVVATKGKEGGKKAQKQNDKKSQEKQTEGKKEGAVGRCREAA